MSYDPSGRYKGNKFDPNYAAKFKKHGGGPGGKPHRNKHRGARDDEREPSPGSSFPHGHAHGRLESSNASVYSHGPEGPTFGGAYSPSPDVLVQHPPPPHSQYNGHDYHPDHITDRDGGRRGSRYPHSPQRNGYDMRTHRDYDGRSSNGNSNGYNGYQESEPPFPYAGAASWMQSPDRPYEQNSTQMVHTQRPQNPASKSSPSPVANQFADIRSPPSAMFASPAGQLDSLEKLAQFQAQIEAEKLKKATAEQDKLKQFRERVLASRAISPPDSVTRKAESFLLSQSRVFETAIVATPTKGSASMPAPAQTLVTASMPEAEEGEIADNTILREQLLKSKLREKALEKKRAVSKSSSAPASLARANVHQQQQKQQQLPQQLQQQQPQQQQPQQQQPQQQQPQHQQPQHQQPQYQQSQHQQLQHQQPQPQHQRPHRQQPQQSKQRSPPPKQVVPPNQTFLTKENPHKSQSPRDTRATLPREAYAAPTPFNNHDQRQERGRSASPRRGRTSPAKRYSSPPPSPLLPRRPSSPDSRRDEASYNRPPSMAADPSSDHRQEALAPSGPSGPCSATITPTTEFVLRQFELLKAQMHELEKLLPVLTSANPPTPKPEDYHRTLSHYETPTRNNEQERLYNPEHMESGAVLQSREQLVPKKGGKPYDRPQDEEQYRLPRSTYSKPYDRNKKPYERPSYEQGYSNHDDGTSKKPMYQKYDQDSNLSYTPSFKKPYYKHQQGNSEGGGYKGDYHKYYQNEDGDERSSYKPKYKYEPEGGWSYGGPPSGRGGHRNQGGRSGYYNSGERPHYQNEYTPRYSNHKPVYGGGGSYSDYGGFRSEY